MGSGERARAPAWISGGWLPVHPGSATNALEISGCAEPHMHQACRGAYGPGGTNSSWGFFLEGDQGLNIICTIFPGLTVKRPPHPHPHCGSQAGPARTVGLGGAMGAWIFALGFHTHQMGLISLLPTPPIE